MKIPRSFPQRAAMRPPRPGALIAVGSVLLGVLACAALAERASSPPTGVESYPTGPLLLPLKVVSTSGNVQNADALVEAHEGYTTLTMAAGGAAPMIILDYGRDVGGLPVFEVTAVSGTPKLQALYSEAQAYLLPAGDGASLLPAAPTYPGLTPTRSAAPAESSTG
jgi:hypothetical protein